jgi:hypothetical protein
VQGKEAAEEAGIRELGGVVPLLHRRRGPPPRPRSGSQGSASSAPGAVGGAEGGRYDELAGDEDEEIHITSSKPACVRAFLDMPATVGVYRSRGVLCRLWICCRPPLVEGDEGPCWTRGRAPGPASAPPRCSSFSAFHVEG